MNKGHLGKILACVVSFSAALFAYLDARNDVTRLMIELPRLSSELSYIEEHNTILQYEVEKFENPMFLLGLLKETEYAHLLSSTKEEIIAISNKDEKIEMKNTVIKGFTGTSLLGTSVR